ncbi:anti-sigma factor [Nocardia sp. NPDC050712]|uniref:anti-sigma factor n=1 Tax=Nocardia sp. NPDC050712 TaxID=3155518 RepID=UPI0033D63E7A
MIGGCERSDLLELAYPYALDAVSESERRAIDRRRERADHRTAVRFDAAVAAVGETLAELTVFDSCPPPAELEVRLKAALDELVRTDSGRCRSVFRLDRLVAAAVLVLAFAAGVGFLVYRANGEPLPGIVSVAEIEIRSDARARTVPVTAGGELSIRSSESLRAAAVDFLAAAPPPPGHAYQIWLSQPGGAPRSAAVLDALPSTPVVIAFATLDTLAVTVEPAGGSPAPTTTPIAGLALGADGR